MCRFMRNMHHYGCDKFCYGCDNYFTKENCALKSALKTLRETSHGYLNHQYWHPYSEYLLS